MRVDASERLIESTQELLWERGYVGTSPKAIQQHAGAGQGSMYHHFAGKSDLALVAVRRSAEQLRALAETQFSGLGTAIERISAYLLREREVLRGCRIGRLAQDPEVIASPNLRQPLDETFDWLRHRLAELLAEGQARDELDGDLDPADTAATILAVLQGGYVLARAADSVKPFNQAVNGVLGLLAARTVSR
jgi:TetR/AcrR family transcriptional repressor of nem operon